MCRREYSISKIFKLLLVLLKWAYFPRIAVSHKSSKPVSKFNFWSKDQLTKKKDRILIKDLISNKRKCKTKEARLILQSGAPDFYQYFWRYGLPSSVSYMQWWYKPLKKWNERNFKCKHSINKWLQTKGIKNVLHFIFLIYTKWFKSFSSLSMRYVSLAFRTLSLLNFISSSGISAMSLAEWSLVRKCSETVVGLEILDG